VCACVEEVGLLGLLGGLNLEIYELGQQKHNRRRKIPRFPAKLYFSSATQKINPNTS
jgi:hypothetical protein